VLIAVGTDDSEMGVDVERTEVVSVADMMTAE